MRLTSFWRRRKIAPPATADGSPQSPIDPLEVAGRRLRERREERNLSLRDLSREIRITTPVLEALERGWRDRLPEAAYLSSMLHRLEQHLELEPGSLNGALPPPQRSRLARGDRGSRRFTIGSIDIFTTWQGSVVYGALMVASILALNHQQRYLAQQGSLALEPMIPSTASMASDPSLAGLRPVEEAQRRSLSSLVPKEQDANRPDPSPTSNPTGVLELQLSRPSSIRLSSAGGDRSELTGSQGRLTLQLRAPVTLSIQPAPAETDQVLWNGDKVTSMAGQDGSYRLPQTSPRTP